MKKKFLVRSLNIAIVLVGIALIGTVGKDTIEYYNSKNTNDELREHVLETDTENDDIDNKEEEIVDFKKMKEINSDYKGWINIEGTKINYPILQSTNNDFYLKNNVNKEASKSGSIFFDYRTDVENDFNKVIYGHNMKNTSMFSDLKKFKNEDYIKSKPTIQMQDENYIYTYEAFSTYVNSGTSDYDYLFNPKLKTEQEKNDYINFLKDKSMFEFQKNESIDTTQIENIITLITCSYEFHEARTIVHARLVEKIKI
ncbi:MAG: class B sortase [Sarcina sp.]